MKSNFSVIIILAAICLCFNERATAQLNLDSAFNAGVTEGKVDVRVSRVLPDGKILVGGGFSFANGVEKNTLVRLNADGTLDATFNQTGIGPSSTVFDIAVLPDGKILIGGIFATYNGVSKPGIARLNADGSLDATFNPGGAGLVGTAQTIAVQTDGKILICGSGISSYNGTARFSVLRLNADGSLDATFTSPFTTAQFIEEVDVQADGKILIGGGFTIGSPARSALARLNADGSLDATFNAAGGGTDGGIFALTIQPDGKILIGGSFSSYNASPRNNIARVNADGSLDASFSLSGSITAKVVEHLAVQPDGKIYAAGFFSDGSLDFGLIRLNSNGSIDSANSLSSVDNFGYHVSLQADGKILFGGFFSRVGGQSRNNLARFNADGTLDGNFVPSFVGFGYASAIAQQADGKIVAVGNFNLANGAARNNVARFNADGSLDTTFNIGTGTSAETANFSNILNSVTFQPDGKILIGGAFGAFNGIARRGIVRLNADGSVDTSFDTSDFNALANVIVNDILVLPDGKVMIGGSFLGLNSKTVLRLNSNGSIDATYTASPNGQVTKLLRQPDGKILAGGSFNLYAGINRSRIVRINPDGSLDSNFNPGAGANSTVVNLALQPDGKIIIAGSFATFNGTNRAGVARLNADGSLDSTFNPGTGTNGTVESVSVQPDGKIFIGGRFTTYNGTIKNRLARINADGSLDAAFVSGFDADPRFFARRTLLQSDGKLLVAGLFKNYNGVTRNALARISPNPAPIASNGQIVFVSNRDGNNEIYKMNADGSGVTRLTNNSVSDSDPQWSPDGTKIVFASSRDGNSELYVMDASGANQLRITNNSFFDTEPTWSPDGAKIAFQSSRGGNRDIYVVNANGSNETRLTTAAGFDILPKWSPNGAQIAFVSNRDGNFEIYAMSANGDSQVRLTTGDATDFSPDWSNDGSVILFSSDRDGNSEIYRMNANGSAQTRLTTNSSNEESPVWSPDNTKIVYTTDRDGNYEVYTINASGTGEQRLTNAAASDGPADWQPRINSIARAPFDFDGDGKSDVGIFRPSVGQWWINRSSTNITFAAEFGSASDKIAPADFTGDGKADLAFWRPSNGFWYILRSEDNSFYGFPFGSSGDVPIAADFDGDGRADQAVFRASNNGWYIQKSSGGIDSITFGSLNDKPVVADYDGDGKADIAITRINNGNREWWGRRSSNGQIFAVTFGDSNDKPVVGDYTGDGKADIAFWRPSNGFWYILRSEDSSFYGFPFGTTGDQPTPGDFDGDGKTDAAVYRQSNNGWYQQRSTQGFTTVTFGTSGDVPVHTAFLP